MSRRLHLVIILPTSPLPIFSGGRQRMFQMLRQLAPRHDITLLCFWRDEQARLGLAQLAETLPLTVIPVPFARLRPNRHLPSTIWRRFRGRISRLPDDIAVWEQPGMNIALNGVLAAKPVDLIQIEWPYLAPYALAHPDVPSVLITHDIFSIALGRRAELEAPGRRQRHLQNQAAAWVRYEQHIYSRFDAVAGMSPTDEAIIRRRAPDANIAILPNGVDAENLTPGEIRQDARNLLFVGSPTHPPNLDAACWFLTEIWPELRRQRPDLTLHLLNLDHPQVRACLQAGVELSGRLPDLVPAYRQADIAIVPMRAGSGTRLKILEAFALGVPVVSTTVGHEGLEVEPGKDLLSADTAVDFGNAILHLLDDVELRRTLAANGRILAETLYDWRIIANRHEAVYRSIIN